MENGKKETKGMASVVAALAANLLVAASKFAGYALSGSAAMLNESIHSVVDCGNQALLLAGDKMAGLKASAEHPFGHARAKYFFSTVVAMMLFFGGGALGIMEAAEKLAHPAHGIDNGALVIAILAFGIVVESASLRVAFREIRELNKGGLPLFKFLRRSRHSEILIIFAEDSCAVLGLLLALGGTGLTMATGNGFYDAFSGLLIGILLCAAAVWLAVEFYSLTVGESVTPEDLATISKAFSVPAVERLIDAKTIHMSPTDILICAKIDIKDGMWEEAPAVINSIEAEIRAALPAYKAYIYIEVDRYAAR